MRYRSKGQEKTVQKLISKLQQNITLNNTETDIKSKTEKMDLKKNTSN